MAEALRHLKKIGGGIVLVEQKKVRAQISLPIGELMSVESLPVLADQVRSLNSILTSMGCSLEVRFLRRRSPQVAPRPSVKYPPPYALRHKDS